MKNIYGESPIVFLTAVFLLFLSGRSHCGDMQLPPSVQNLIGMKLQPVHVKGKNIKSIKPLPTDYVSVYPAVIPGFINVGGALFFENTNPKYSLAYNEGFADGKWPVFLIERIYEDMTKEILDVQGLPEKLIEWKIDGQQARYIKGRFRLSENCRFGDENDLNIFGLVKPEQKKSNCGHFSKHVIRAWKINTQSGRVNPIATRGLQCYFLTMNEC